MSEGFKCDIANKQALDGEISLKGFISGSRNAAHFMLTRYPYLCAVLLMVSIPEEANRRTFSMPNIRTVYFQLGLYFFSGTLMSFDMFGLRRLLTYVFVGQIAIQSYLEFASGYSEVMIVRLLCRNLACAGSYLVFAGGVLERSPNVKRNNNMIKIGRQLIGTYILLMAIILCISDIEFNNHAKSLPLTGNISTWFLILCYFACGFCIDYGVSIAFSCKLLMFLLMIVTITVDLDTDIWLSSGDIQMWKAITIACRHIPVISILMLIHHDSHQL